MHQKEYTIVYSTILTLINFLCEITQNDTIYILNSIRFELIYKSILYMWNRRDDLKNVRTIEELD